MAHGKLFRSFIILQEDERGHSISNDKPLSGYTKVEAKGDKCKIAFYAQNLKADYNNCQMILVCNKKDGKYNVNLGPVNISPQGKAEMSVEYDANNIGDFGVSYDKIVGASLCKEISGKTVFLMCGFINGEQPKDNWKNYKVMMAKKEDKKATASNKDGNKHSQANKQEHKENNKGSVGQNSWSNGNKENIVNNNQNIANTNTNANKDNNWQNNNNSNMTNDNWSNNNNTNLDNNWSNNNNSNMDNNWSNNNNTNKDNSWSNNNNTNKDNSWSNNNNSNMDNNWSNNNNSNMNSNWADNNYHENIEHKHDHKNNYNNSNDRDDLESKFDDYEREIDGASRDEDDFELRGAMGDFFNSVIDEFEFDRGFTKEIKNCKWYKVKVNDFDDMCNASHYNKYTVAYYPMINYYPYIAKHGHFMLGLKCDSNGVVKYVVYGVPGSKDKKDQPYGGKTGFVTWCPNSKGGNTGHWLMFYDFQNSMVVVPMK